MKERSYENIFTVNSAGCQEGIEIVNISTYLSFYLILTFFIIENLKAKNIPI